MSATSQVAKPLNTPTIPMSFLLAAGCFFSGAVVAGLTGRMYLRGQLTENPARTPTCVDNEHGDLRTAGCQELQEVKNHLQLVIDTMSDGLITIDSDGVVVSMNHMACKITGYDPQNCKGLAATELLGDAIERRTNFIDPKETSVRHADGKNWPVELSIRVAAVANQGRLFLASIRDVSELKRAQKLLLQQAHIIEKSESFVFVTDKHHCIEWCNPRFEKITGYRLTEIIGETPGSFMFGESTASDSRALIQQAISEHKAYNTELLLYHKAGRPFWAQIDVHPLLDELGQLEKYVGLGFETTERKFSDQMQVDFVSMVSHELRTPLTVIAGALDALTLNPAGRTPEVIDMLVEMGQRNCVRLEKLIEDLLDINKMESGTFSFKCENIDLSELAGEAVQQVASLATHAQVTIELEKSAQPATVFVDPLRIAQVLCNLLSNAIKFSYGGSDILVKIETIEAVQTAGPTVRVSVRDQGRGIPQNFRPMMFRKFSREASVQADGTEGFGLGLSICKRLVEQMNGFIDYESKQGDGACFYFDLPLIHATTRNDNRVSVLNS